MHIQAHNIIRLISREHLQISWNSELQMHSQRHWIQCLSYQGLSGMHNCSQTEPKMFFEYQYFLSVLTCIYCPWFTFTLGISPKRTYIHYFKCLLTGKTRWHQLDKVPQVMEVFSSGGGKVYAIRVLLSWVKNKGTNIFPSVKLYLFSAAVPLMHSDLLVLFTFY